MSSTIKVGVIGCGNISPAYFHFCKTFEILEIVACADLIPERARAKAKEFGIARACSNQELLADPEIQIVLNLTNPKAHAEVNLSGIEAGKHVYGEKPLATSREDGLKTIEAATARGVRVGNAPDTFFGGGIQTARKLIDDGAIGRPVAATAFMTCHGHEGWHPDPAFYYQVGGGPMLDMGPYYMTALVNLLGPAVRVTGSTRITFPERLITSKPKHGTVIKVEVPTHVSGVIDFADGAVATIIMSFDIWAAGLPWIEIYGTEGSMKVPDPNCFGGQVLIRKPGDDDWRDMALTHSAETGRGIGVADMAYGILHNRPHRASGALAYHVLEIMQAFEESSRTGRHVAIASHVERPAALPVGPLPGVLDIGD